MVIFIEKVSLAKKHRAAKELIMLLISVTGMTCQHCVKAVTNAINELDANAKITVDLTKNQVQVASSLDAKLLANAIEAEGYKVLAIETLP